MLDPDQVSDHPGEKGSAAGSIVRAGLALLVIMSGLALRRYGLGLGLPTPVVKYRGSMLWGTMVFFLLATIASGLTRRSAGLIAAVIAVGVELFRLVHTASPDAFRLTTAGAPHSAS